MPTFEPLQLRPAQTGVSSSGALDWQRLALNRLGYLSAVAVGVGLIGALLLLLRQPNTGADNIRAGTERPAIVVPIWVGLSALVWVVSRWESLPAQRRIDMGLLYAVVTCFIGGLFRHWLPYAETDVVRGFSPIALAILFLSVVVPVEPRRMAITAVLCAVMDAVALGVTVTVIDNPTPPWNLWVWLLVPDFVCAALAYMSARFLFSLGEKVRKAQEMGAYQLVEKLGAGGMGEVWRAEHRTLARRAAIKIIPPDRLGARDHDSAQRTIRRFEREARATATLGSHHTIEVYDFGTAEDGTFYYVMELLEGLDLGELVEQKGPLSAERTAYLLLQICHSLQDAHEHGLIHRDIKPANIVVCRKGPEWDFIKVLDFGLVKLTSGVAEDATLTQENAVMGSPAFMAPEAMDGGQNVTASVDIYALGCVAYWLLTGRLIFDKDNPFALLMAHLTEVPKDLLEIDPTLPTSLTEIVMGCLAKTADERPESVEVLAQQITATGLAARWDNARARAWWLEHAPESSVHEEGLASTDTKVDTVSAIRSG